MGAKRDPPISLQKTSKTSMIERMMQRVEQMEVRWRLGMRESTTHRCPTTLAIHNGTNLLSNPITLRRSERLRKASTPWESPPKKQRNGKKEGSSESSSESRGNSRGKNSTSSDSQTSTIDCSDRITLITGGSQGHTPSNTSQSCSDMAICTPFNQHVYIVSAEENDSKQLPIPPPSNDTNVESAFRRNKENVCGGLLLSRSTTVDSTFQTSEISHALLRQKIVDLFGETAWDKPCISARLFAYCILQSPDETNMDMLHILQSLVTIEQTVLQDLDLNHQHHKTCFCSFDLSFLPTIIDSKPNLKMIENATQAICEFLKQVRIVFIDAKNPNISRFLTRMIETLLLFQDKSTMDGPLLSSTMPGLIQWPIQRFVIGSKYYGSELQVLASRLSNPDVTTQHLQVEHFLGKLVDRLIRYYLRLFFNAQPPVLTTPSEQHPAPDFSSTRSRVHTMILLQYKNNTSSRGAAAADGCISSFVNTALRRIYDWQQNFVQEDLNHYPLESLSATTMRGSIPPTECEIQDITLDIHYLHRVRLGADACRFLAELLTWPDVDNAIRAVGGWSEVEKYATLLDDYNLGQIQPDMAHFVLLKNVSYLIHQLNEKRKMLEVLEHECHERLQFIWKQFKCGTRNKKLGKELIATLLKEADESTLPSLVNRIN